MSRVRGDVSYKRLSKSPKDPGVNKSSSSPKPRLRPGGETAAFSSLLLLPRVLGALEPSVVGRRGGRKRGEGRSGGAGLEKGTEKQRGPQGTESDSEESVSHSVKHIIKTSSPSETSTNIDPRLESPFLPLFFFKLLSQAFLKLPTCY